MPDKVTLNGGLTMKFYKSIIVVFVFCLTISSYGENNSDRLTSLVFDRAWQFSEGRAVVMNNGKFSVIDIEGKYIVSEQYDFIGDFHGGLAVVKSGSKWGFINREGKTAVPVVYEYVSIFSDGLAEIRVNGKSGFIDATGKVVIQPAFEKVFPFSEGLAGVVVSGRLGYIDHTGLMKIEPRFDVPKWTNGKASDFPSDVPRVCLGDGWGYLNKNGVFTLPEGWKRFKRSPSFFIEGLAAASLNGKAGFIDKNGNEKIPFIYDECSFFRDGYAAFRSNSKWGLIDRTGKGIIPGTYKNLQVPSEGLIRFSKGDGTGFIDLNEKVVIRPEYDSATAFFGDLAAVVKKDKLGFIDKTGVVVIPLIYEKENDTFGVNTMFVEGFAPVRENGKYKFIAHPFPPEKIKENTVKYGKFIGVVREIKKNEVIVGGGNIAETVTMGDRLIVDTGSGKSIYMSSVFPMMTVVRCIIVKGSASEVKPGMKVYRAAAVP